MKPKNIVFIASSLDGYIADKNGALDWLHLIPNPESVDMGFYPLMQEIDAVVMGRTTFEVVCGFGGEWPYSKPVYVLSNTLKTVPESLEGKVIVLKGSPHTVISQIQQNGQYVLYIDGGRTIQSFLQEDLIDELCITTIPILLGGGFSLFGELAQPLAWELVDSKVFLQQIVQNIYRRKRAIQSH